VRPAAAFAIVRLEGIVCDIRATYYQRQQQPGEIFGVDQRDPALRWRRNNAPSGRAEQFKQGIIARAIDCGRANN
jgi:hypothetical protein